MGPAAGPASGRGALADLHLGRRSSDELEIFGHPHLRVRVTSRPADRLPVRRRSADVFPDGASSLVVRGMTNIAHRATIAGGSRRAVRARPRARGDRLDLRAPAIGSALDLAGADWPNAWPPPNRSDAHDRTTAPTMLELPVLDGPPVADPPAIRVVTGQQHGLESNDEGWWRWEVDEPADGMHVARTGYGGTSTNEGAARAYRDRYEGTVGASTDRSRRRVLRRRGRVRDRVPRGDRSHAVASARRLRRRGLPRLDRAHRLRGRAGTLLETLGSRVPARRTVGVSTVRGGCRGRAATRRPRSRRSGSGRSRTATRGATEERTPRTAPPSTGCPTKPPHPWYRW